MNFETSKNYQTKLRQQLAEIQTAMDAVSKRVNELNINQQQIEQQSFYEEKAQELATIKGELKELKQEQITLSESKLTMLAHQDSQHLYTSIIKEVTERYASDTIQPIQQQVLALNESIRQAKDLDDALIKQIREDLDELAPYLCDKDFSLLHRYLYTQSFYSDVRNVLEQLKH